MFQYCILTLLFLGVLTSSLNVTILFEDFGAAVMYSDVFQPDPYFDIDLRRFGAYGSHYLEPVDYWELWVNDSCSNITNHEEECFFHILEDCDILSIMHGISTSRMITSSEDSIVESHLLTLDNYKLQYEALGILFQQLYNNDPSKKVIIWSPPAIHEELFVESQGLLMNQFVDWIKDTWLPSTPQSVRFFDLWSITSNWNKPCEGDIYALRRKYQDDIFISPNPNIPNQLGINDITDYFLQALIQFNLTNDRMWPSSPPPVQTCRNTDGGNWYILILVVIPILAAFIIIAFGYKKWEKVRSDTIISERVAAMSVDLGNKVKELENQHKLLQVETERRGTLAEQLTKENTNLKSQLQQVVDAPNLELENVDLKKQIVTMQERAKALLKK